MNKIEEILNRLKNVKESGPGKWLFGIGSKIL